MCMCWCLMDRPLAHHKQSDFGKHLVSVPFDSSARPQMHFLLWAWRTINCCLRWPHVQFKVACCDTHLALQEELRRGWEQQGGMEGTGMGSRRKHMVTVRLAAWEAADPDPSKAFKTLLRVSAWVPLGCTSVPDLCTSLPAS